MNSAEKPPGDWGYKEAEALRSGTKSECPCRHPNCCEWYEVRDDEQGSSLPGSRQIVSMLPPASRE